VAFGLVLASPASLASSASPVPRDSPASAPRGSPAGAPRIAVGEPIVGRLEPSDPLLPGHGPSKRYELRAETEVPIAVTLVSSDFDAFLRVEDAAGGLVGEDVPEIEPFIQIGWPR
jgi:hypothetical protein